MASHAVEPLSNQYPQPKITPYSDRILSDLIVVDFQGDYDDPYTALNYTPSGSNYGPVYRSLKQQIPKTGKYHCRHGVAKFKGGHVYEGEFDSGLMHGKGRLCWPDGTTYEGTFVDNTITGQGRFVWSDGSTYEGEVDHGLRNGEGVFEGAIDAADFKMVYEGTWSKGKREGQGSLHYNRDAIYVGSFSNNMRHGNGKMIYASGNTYEGDWKDDLRHGSGTMVWEAVSEEYTGEWVDGVQNGHGEHTWHQQRLVGSQYPLQNKYVGEFVDGLRHGQGTFLYASGEKYIGAWIQNLKSGEATYITQEGENRATTWFDDKLIPPLATPPEKQVACHFHLEDLPGGDDKNQISEVYSVLMRHMSDLRMIYNKYGHYGFISHTNTYVLKRIQFHRLMKDIGIEAHGLTLNDVDDVVFPVGEADTWSKHGIFDEFLPRQFFEAIVRVAYKVFASKFADAKFPLAQSFSELIVACDIDSQHIELRGILFKLEKSQACFVIENIELFEKAHTQYGVLKSTGETILDGRRLIKLCQDCNFFGSSQCDVGVLLKVIEKSHAAMATAKCVDTRIALSLLDMIEVLLGCVFYKRSKRTTCVFESVDALSPLPEDASAEVQDAVADALRLYQPPPVLIVQDTADIDVSSLKLTETQSVLDGLIARLL
eukprot:m.12648 g.12648  ORF g.12648 m.12648 type:complete len:655 (+) comp9392_c0_seq1:326-2290(+)